MIRQAIFLGTLHFFTLSVHGQQTIPGSAVVVRDITGRITTSFRTKAGTTTYLGSEYLTFPIWQPGTMTLGSTGREISCRLCYNIYTDQLLYQLEDSTVRQVFPDEFSINSALFIKQSLDGSARRRASFYLVRYAGSGAAKLLEHAKCLFLTASEYPFQYQDGRPPYDGYYKIESNYYIQKESDRLQLVDLTKKSFLTALFTEPYRQAPSISKEQLTVHEAIGVVAYYDSLIVVEQAQKPALSKDRAFYRTLRTQLHYPKQASQKRVYGRVYIGFEINNQGQIKNIQPQSPDNVGYGFIDEVVGALGKIQNMDTAYSGSYILPVTFEYLKSTDSGIIVLGPQTILPADHFDNRRLLDEVKISITNHNDLTP